MTNLRQNLDIILEEESADAWHPLETATDLVSQLQHAQQMVADLNHKLAGLKTRMSGDLALALRKARPALNVAVDKHSCKVGYKTKLLQFWPEVELGLWRVTSPNRRFLREFLQANRRATLLSSDLHLLVAAISDYFAAYYRTLGESIDGTGLILVEEKRVTLLELASWRLESTNQTPLKTRRLRGVSPC